MNNNDSNNSNECASAIVIKETACANARAISDLRPRVQLHLSGCPTPVIDRYLLDTTIETCEKTLAWQYEQPPVKLSPGGCEYRYDTRWEAEVHALQSASVNDSMLIPATVQQIMDCSPRWPNEDISRRSRPRLITSLDADHFAVAPSPDGDEEYIVRAITYLKPLRTSRTMDKAVLDELEECIVYGTLWRLLEIPNRPWSNNELSTMHGRHYMQLIALRRSRTNIGTARASLKVRLRRFI